VSVPRVIRLAVRTVLIVAALLAAAIFGWALNSRGMPELEAWHTTKLPSQFTRKDIESMSGLADYLQREDQLFAELEEQVYDQADPASGLDFNRYHRGSNTDPTSLPQNFNRSYQLQPSGTPRCGVLLVHGLSDSPYSMRHLAETYVAEGCSALVLRMPGHGTVPLGLVTASWHDWRAAVALGAQAVRDRIGASAPLFMASYSNGGALVLGHALDALDDRRLAKADGLMLFSPMIGVTPFSRLADLGDVLTRFQYFAQFAWLDILPEYDPYKYNSFPKNAGYQTFLVTRALREQLQALEDDGRLAEIPPTLTFQSLVDATVSMPAVVNELYGRVQTSGSELVLFDLNRTSSLAPFLSVDHRQFVENLLLGDKLTYDITLLGNLDRSSRVVGTRHRPAGSDEISKTPLNLSWPSGVYSLSHLALVIPPEDEFYGTAEASAAAGKFNLGSLQPRGERGVTSIPVANLVRLRHNPFYDYVAQRLREDISRLLEP
jgi:alpha-beta hydrolase superfamily lysophospholipase